MPINEVGTVNDVGLGLTTGLYKELLLDTTGALVTMDFFLKAMLDGKGFQLRAGTITTPLVGKVTITDTAAEFCIDPPAGTTILPVTQNISIRLATGTLLEFATKSVATASSAGTAFTLLPLLPGGAAAGSSARVSAAGGVTVTAELATTTRRHWSYANPVAAGAGNDPGIVSLASWEPRCPPPIKSTAATAWCLYTQIAATTTGPSYYANLDIFEFASASLGV